MINKQSAKDVVLRMRSDPVWFCNEILDVKPWAKQQEIMFSVRDNKKTAVRSCHGVGKSFIAGNTILWFLYSFAPSIVLSTAPTWRQVEKLIWKEVRSSYRKAKVDLGGNLLPKSPEIQIVQDEWYAAGLSTNDPNRFQGFHESNILVVVDEAAGVPEDIFEGIEGVLTSEHSRLLLLGNPTEIGGTFYKAFQTPGWNRIAISPYDTPNFTMYGIKEDDIADGTWEEKLTGPLPFPKLITPDWVADKYRSWGPTSPAYQARAKGQFPSGADDTVIPLAWVEAAMERWEDMPEETPIELGIDVARFGSDSSVIAPRKGYKIVELKIISKHDTMEVAGISIERYHYYEATHIKVDVIGIGAGVVDRLNEQGYPVTGINVSQSPIDKERFCNLRSELWWNLREMLDPDPAKNPTPIGLPPDDELLFELSSVKYRYNSNGQIQIESKKDMKKRLGRSPDRADAVVLAFAPNGSGDSDLYDVFRGVRLYG